MIEERWRRVRMLVKGNRELKEGASGMCRLKDQSLTFSPEGLSCVCPRSLSRDWLFETQWTVAHQAPLSMGFPRQEYWSGLPFPAPGGLPNPGLNPHLIMFPILVGRFFTIPRLQIYPSPIHFSIDNHKFVFDICKSVSIFIRKLVLFF